MTNNKRLKFGNIIALFFLTFICMCFIPGTLYKTKATEVVKVTEATEDENIIKEGIYYFNIVDKKIHTLELIGYKLEESITHMYIPEQVIYKGEEYHIESIRFWYSLDNDPKEAQLSKNITDITIPAGFTGKLFIDSYYLSNLKTIQFEGDTPPALVKLDRDILLAVPKGKIKDYKKIVEVIIDHANGSDLTEKTIIVSPTIVDNITNNIEYSLFVKDEIIYNVTKKAGNDIGQVELAGVTREARNKYKHGYIKLPKKVTNNGYTYKLTSLSSLSLVSFGAKIIVVPNSVTKMESAVFDEQVEVLFLSKNCKTIPRRITTSENNDSSLVYVYIPEGVTTLEKDAFNSYNSNIASVILPKTLTTIGEKALYAFKTVTFLNNKPLNDLTKIINPNATIKVTKSALSDYKNKLKSLSKVTVKEAKSVIKTNKISFVQKEIVLNTLKIVQLKGTLSTQSNETIFYASSNSDIFEISSTGVISPKKAGTAYVFAYTRTSGKYATIKVTVTYKKIKDGIFTYRITNASKKTVSLCAIEPDDKSKEIIIPKEVTYKKNKYTVISACADEENTEIPLITNKENTIEKITFPDTIIGIVGYLGEMRNIKFVIFEGNKAPSNIKNWHNDDAILAYNAVIYVPATSVNQYNDVLDRFQDLDGFCAYGQFGKIVFNVLPIGTKQLIYINSDGFLYEVTKQASTTKNGTVKIIGVNTSLNEFQTKPTIVHGNYKYDVIEIDSSAFIYSNAETIILNDSIEKVGSLVFNGKVKSITWSKNCTTIPMGLFNLHGTSLETFIIPEGVTTIKKGAFGDSKLENLKSITIPSTMKKIGENVLDGIENVYYVKN